MIQFSKPAIFDLITSGIGSYRESMSNQLTICCAGRTTPSRMPPSCIEGVFSRVGRKGKLTLFCPPVKKGLPREHCFKYTPDVH